MKKKMIETSSFYTSVPSYDIWFLRYQLKQTDFLCHLGPFFALLRPPPLTAPKDENIKKLKTPGDIIILHKCAKNHDYMLYCSWDMACDTCNCCFSFWAIFWPFTPLTAQKIKISKKKKKKKTSGDVIILHMCTINYD